MPLHNWSHMSDGDFQSFHGMWIASLTTALNNGALPNGFSAVPDKAISLLGFEPETKRRDPDVLAVETAYSDLSWSEPAFSLKEEEPVATLVHSHTNYHERQRMIWVLDSERQPVAAIEIISPGNKSTAKIADEFAEKCIQYLEGNLSVTIIDLLPGNDRLRLPERIARHLGDQTLERANSPFEQLVASYAVGRPSEPGSSRVYIAEKQPGEKLPDAALFLDNTHFVKLPLEQTYVEALNGLGHHFVDQLTR